MRIKGRCLIGSVLFVCGKSSKISPEMFQNTLCIFSIANKKNHIIIRRLKEKNDNRKTARAFCGARAVMVNRKVNHLEKRSDLKMGTAPMLPLIISMALPAHVLHDGAGTV